MSLTAAIVAGVVLAGGLAGSKAAPAAGAQLVGGRRQAAVERAFLRNPSHRHLLIVSVRASTATRTWSAVESVRPEAAGRTGTGARRIEVRHSFFHLLRGGERAANPPSSVRTELSRDFKVAVVFSGSGAERIGYGEENRTACAGAGGLIDQQSATVDPMAWRVRYVVDLDHLAAALGSDQSPIIEPVITLDRAGSALTAIEHISRSSVDLGCGTPPRISDCTIRFTLPGSGLDGILSPVPGAGLEVGVPLRAEAGSGCDPENFILGPSLWDGGASTASVPALGLVGGALPARPYAPIRVTWPGASALSPGGWLTSPCQGIPALCTDSLHWAGTVRLEPVGGG